MESCFISKHNYTFLYTLVLTKFFFGSLHGSTGKVSEVGSFQSILDCCCSCSSCRDIYLFWWLGGKTKGLLSKQKSGLFYMEKRGQNLISDPNYPKSKLPHSTLNTIDTNNKAVYTAASVANVGQGR